MPKIVEDYNNTRHSFTGYAPARVTPKIAEIIKETVSDETEIFERKKPPKFKVSDKVRISIEKELFTKSYEPEWSSEIFVIKKVYHTIPYTYEIKDLDDEDVKGRFYEPELAHSRFPLKYLIEKILKKKGDKVPVKWVGSNGKTWEKKKDLDI